MPSAPVAFEARAIIRRRQVQMRRLIVLLGSATAVCTSATRVLAQPPSASPVAVVCEDRIISDVEIVRQEPTIIGETAPRWTRGVLRTLLRHTLTRDVAIEPFLLVEPGGPCSEFRLAESARVLRAQPYLAKATVTSVADSAGRVRV